MLVMLRLLQLQAEGAGLASTHGSRPQACTNLTPDTVAAASLLCSLLCALTFLLSLLLRLGVTFKALAFSSCQGRWNREARQAPWAYHNSIVQLLLSTNFLMLSLDRTKTKY